MNGTTECALMCCDELLVENFRGELDISCQKSMLSSSQHFYYHCQGLAAEDTSALIDNEWNNLTLWFNTFDLMNATNNWVFTYGKSTAEIESFHENFVKNTCSTQDTWMIDQCDALLDSSGKILISQSEKCYTFSPPGFKK